MHVEQVLDDEADRLLNVDFEKSIYESTNEMARERAYLFSATTKKVYENIFTEHISFEYLQFHRASSFFSFSLSDYDDAIPFYSYKIICSYCSFGNTVCQS